MRIDEEDSRNKRERTITKNGFTPRGSLPEEEQQSGQILSTVGNFLSTFVTTLIVLVAVIFVVIRLLGWSLYSVDSYSMTPTYPINSLVIVQPVDAEAIQVGDVITFVIDEEGTMVTHRVTSISSLNRTFTTKGDAHDEEDASPVLWDNVVGRVFLGIPVLRGLLRILTAEENRAAVIAVIIGLLFVSIAWDVVSQCRKKRRKKTTKASRKTPGPGRDRTAKKEREQKMIKSKRLKLICVAIMLVVVFSSVSSSLAWLSAATEPVVNYFSGRAIAITLDEAPVDADGKATDGNRVQENHYKYVAGADLDKDPTLTVLKNSEECDVYVCVDNELPGNLFTLDINSAWTLVSSAGNKTIYRYSTVVESSTSDQKLTPVFTHVTISSSLTAENITELGDKTITVTSLAIQTASLETATANDLAEAYFYNGVDIAAIEAETPEPTATEDPEATTEATSVPDESNSEAEAMTAPDDSDGDDAETEATAVPVDTDTEEETNDTTADADGETSADTETDAAGDSSGTEDNTAAETNTESDKESAA